MITRSAGEKQAERLREVLGGLDEASLALDEASLALGAAREVCDELGHVAEEERHDCSMAIGIIEEVYSVIQSATKPTPRSEPDISDSPADLAAGPEEEGADG